ncbi:MFS transporter [Rugosimonospora africana]|uniref:MFS transporter n=1 Tax=Rugosimonospora africana TaxID=556532 RepID=A0A8J3QS16_9ACTN|nr:MFS transporter [Rugosimonospora africana]GIH15604.1 MFS transporter [Rugosimonospora africana]
MGQIPNDPNHDRNHDSGAVATLSPSRPGARRRWVPLAVLLVGTSLIVLDFFVVNVALPSIQRDLHASASGVEWVVAGYGLAFAVLLNAAGRISDRIGRRRLFAAGVALFVVASAACGAAPTTAVLIGARVVQGGAAALISPTVLALIGVLYPGPDRPRAISAYGMVMGVAAAAGQLIGGGLVTADIGHLGWRTIFLVNVPVGLLGLALVHRYVPESRAQDPARVDRAGLVLATLSLTALLLPLIQGRELDWPAWSLVSLALFPALVGLAYRQQRSARDRGGSPLLDPSLLADRSLRAGLLGQLVFWCTQASSYLILALYLQQGRGLTALRAGLVFTVLTAAYLAVSVRAPALTLRFGHAVVAAGALTEATGAGLLAVTVAVIGTAGPTLALAPGLILVGVGQGLCITPLTTTVLRHADRLQAGAVSGALSTMQQVGNSIGVAVTGLVFFPALASGYAAAFRYGLAEIAALLVVVAALARTLPERR